MDPEKVLSQCYNQGLDTVNSRSIQMLVGVMEQEIKRKIEEPEVEPEPPGLMRPQQRAKEAKRYMYYPYRQILSQYRICHPSSNKLTTSNSH